MLKLTTSSSLTTSDREEKQYHNTQEIGKWGEELVYKWYIWHYQNKLTNTQCQEENGCCTITGSHKRTQQPMNIAIRWHNYSEETREPKDLTIRKNDQEKVIEVKTTMSYSSNSAPSANLTRHEMQEMKHQGQQYRFFRVFDAFSPKPSIVKYVNPAQMIENGEIEVTDIKLKL